VLRANALVRGERSALGHGHPDGSSPRGPPGKSPAASPSGSAITRCFVPVFRSYPQAPRPLRKPVQWTDAPRIAQNWHS
jgi:hypothetical protein